MKAGGQRNGGTSPRKPGMGLAFALWLLSALLPCPPAPAWAAAAPDRTLIVCYSWGGNTRRVAELLRRKTGADLYEIRTVRPYPADPWETSRISQREWASGRLPELAGDFPDIAGYDLILAGGPVWNFKTATPLAAYLERTDFRGRRVAPFWTDQRAAGDYEADFRRRAKNARLLPGLGLSGVKGQDDATLSARLDEWLNRVAAPGAGP